MSDTIILRDGTVVLKDCTVVRKDGKVVRSTECPPCTPGKVAWSHDFGGGSIHFLTDGSVQLPNADILPPTADEDVRAMEWDDRAQAYRLATGVAVYVDGTVELPSGIVVHPREQVCILS
jgi:hypothetical protein